LDEIHSSDSLRGIVLKNAKISHNFQVLQL